MINTLFVAIFNRVQDLQKDVCDQSVVVEVTICYRQWNGNVSLVGCDPVGRAKKEIMMDGKGI